MTSFVEYAILNFSGYLLLKSSTISIKESANSTEPPASSYLAGMNIDMNAEFRPPSIALG